ncbi:MAG: hypothetical protein R3E12_04040 [Candidatus Eisenbacteria bacterium]
MRKVLAGMLFVGLAVCALPAFAVDMDNNGIENDEGYVPGEWNGQQEGGPVVVFPTSADTWQVQSYPYWWHVGDTVFGNYNPSLSGITHADIALKLDQNVLSGTGHCDIDFRINGTTVGSFTLLPSDGTGTVLVALNFAPVNPPFELRYYETNLVDPGAGSVAMNETGLNSITFSGDPTPIEESSWGKVKSLYADN